MKYTRYLHTLIELYFMNFCNNYFDEAVVTFQGSFPRDIKNTYSKNSLEGCFGNLNLV